MKGSPNNRNGCFANAERYRAAMVLVSAAERNLRLVKIAMLPDYVDSGEAVICDVLESRADPRSILFGLTSSRKPLQ